MNIYLQQILSISLPNKYTKWYISIIENSKYVNGYGENHHILPKCFKLGGEKSSENIVKLTAREHYICHLLLAKMFEGKMKHKMIYAANMLKCCSKNQLRNFQVNSTIYNNIKQELSKIVSSNLKNKIPWNKGKTGIYSEQHREKISNARKGKPTTKGVPNPHSAANGKKGAKKLSETVSGRKIKTLPDGKRIWIYPDKDDGCIG